MPDIEQYTHHGLKRPPNHNCAFMRHSLAQYLIVSNVLALGNELRVLRQSRLPSPALVLHRAAQAGSAQARQNSFSRHRRALAMPACACETSSRQKRHETRRPFLEAPGVLRQSGRGRSGGRHSLQEPCRCPLLQRFAVECRQGSTRIELWHLLVSSLRVCFNATPGKGADDACIE